MTQKNAIILRLVLRTGVFLLVIIITTAAIFMAAKSGDAPETVRENVNPYSNKGSYPDYKRNDTDL